MYRQVYRSIFSVMFLFCLGLGSHPAGGAIIYVDDDNTAGPWYGTALNPYQYIQHGINAAVSGIDDIEVAPGTYYETINFIGKAVRLYSSGGASVTTINGTGHYHVVQCVNGEDPTQFSKALPSPAATPTAHLRLTIVAAECTTAAAARR